jgi:hypothetical protein
LWFISWVPQRNGSYNFEWQRTILRSELAKIISISFTEQLFDVEDVVKNSRLYQVIVQAINQVQWDKLLFIYKLFDSLKQLDSTYFLNTIKMSKEFFLENLQNIILVPIIEEKSFIQWAWWTWADQWAWWTWADQWAWWTWADQWAWWTWADQWAWWTWADQWAWWTWADLIWESPIWQKNDINDNSSSQTTPWQAAEDSPSDENR